jgi:hypothetical protein
VSASSIHRQAGRHPPVAGAIYKQTIVRYATYRLECLCVAHCRIPNALMRVSELGNSLVFVCFSLSPNPLDHGPGSSACGAWDVGTIEARRGVVDTHRGSPTI